MPNKKDELEIELEITEEEIQRMDRTELTGYIKGVNLVLENMKVNQDFYANKREIANNRLRELIHEITKPLPDVASYFELTKMYELRGEDLKEHQKIIKDLTENNQSQAECIRKMEKEIYDSNNTTVSLALHQKVCDENVEFSKANEKLEKEIEDLNKMYPIDPDNPTVELSVYEETCEELKLSKQKIEFWLNKEKPELQQAVAESTKDLNRLFDENKELTKSLEWNKEKLEECESSSREITKDLFRLNDENKDHLKTIEQLKIKI